MQSTDDSVFRRQALEWHARGQLQEKGAPLRIAPSWTRWSYRLLLSAIVLAGVLAGITSLPDHVSGPAMVTCPGALPSVGCDIVVLLPTLSSTRTRYDGSARLLVDGATPEAVRLEPVSIEPFDPAPRFSTAELVALVRALPHESRVVVRGHVDTPQNFGNGTKLGTIEIVVGAQPLLGLIPGLGKLVEEDDDEAR